MSIIFQFIFILLLPVLINAGMVSNTAGQENEEKAKVGTILNMRESHLKLVAKLDSITRQSCAECFGLSKLPKKVVNFGPRRWFFGQKQQQQINNAIVCSSLKIPVRLAFLRQNQCPITFQVLSRQKPNE